MTPLANTIQRMIPGLRRYATALTGERREGDWYIRAALETLLEEPSRISANGDVKFQLYKLLSEILATEGLSEILATEGLTSFEDIDESDADEPAATASFKQRIMSLPTLTRSLLLLVVLEEFSVQQAAVLLSISRHEAEAHMIWVRRQFSDTDTRLVASAANDRFGFVAPRRLPRLHSGSTARMAAR